MRTCPCEGEGDAPVPCRVGHHEPLAFKFGERLAAGASTAYSVAGWTQVYAVATTPTVKVSVAVGRQ